MAVDVLVSFYQFVSMICAVGVHVSVFDCGMCARIVFCSIELRFVGRAVGAAVKGTGGW